MENWELELPRVLTMASSSSSGSSSKQAWAPINGTETTVLCSVDECTSDLNNCRNYHRRHKVCEVHSKTPKVMISGQEQRFCQQCSRFHLLVEFDEAKRSCRKRLDGHNRRRRKPQLEPFTISSESLFSDHQGIWLLPFSGPQLFPSTTDDRISMWTGAIKTDDDAEVYISHQDNNSVPVLQNQPAPEVSIGHRLNAIASSQNNELTGVIDSDCAFSLLSSPQQIQASGISLDHSIPLAQPIITAGLQYNNGLPVRYQSPQIEQEPMDAVLSSNNSEPELHCQGVFHMQTEDEQEHVSPDSPQTFPVILGVVDIDPEFGFLSTTI